MMSSQPVAVKKFNTAGFSVLELLVALIVVAVISATAAPLIPVMRARMQIDNGARVVAIELQRARMKAVGENAFCRVVFFSNGTYIRQKSSDGNAYVNDSALFKLPDGVQFAGYVGGLPQPTFNRLGTLASDSVLILTNRDGQHRIIVVNVLGKITTL